jgi:hypothetical protein
MAIEPRIIHIDLDITTIDEDTYDTVLREFMLVIDRMGLDGDKFSYDKWRITCVAEESTP